MLEKVLRPLKTHIWPSFLGEYAGCCKTKHGLIRRWEALNITLNTYIYLFSSTTEEHCPLSTQTSMITNIHFFGLFFIETNKYSQKYQGRQKMSS